MSEEELDLLRIRREQMVANEISQSKKERLNEIIYDLMKENIREFDPHREDNHMWPILEEIVNRLKKFRDEEL